MTAQPKATSVISLPNHSSEEVDARRQQLARFLRSRREKLRPQDVGLSSSPRRRTPGLRREEVAVLANVGVTWYTWLEQARDIGVSAEVIDAIGQALQLEGADLEHFYDLAGKPQPVRRSAADEVRAMMDRTVDGFTTTPAYAVDRYWNVIATNSIAEYVFNIQVGSNCLESFFTRPDIAAHYPHRELAGRMMAAQFHRQAAMYSGDPTFEMLAEKISAVSNEFKDYWDNYVVGVEPHVDLVFDHSQLGRLTFESVVLNPVGGNDLRVFLYLPKIASGTTEALGRIS